MRSCGRLAGRRARRPRVQLSSSRHGEKSPNLFTTTIPAVPNTTKCQMKGIPTCCCISDRVNYGWNERVFLLQSPMDEEQLRAGTEQRFCPVSMSGGGSPTLLRTIQGKGQDEFPLPVVGQIPPPKLSLAILVTGPTIGRYQTGKIPIHQSCDGRRAYRGRRGKGESMLCCVRFKGRSYSR